MNIDVMPTLIDQFRETFEGEVTKDMVWITDGPVESAVFGVLDSLSPEEALAAPAPGVKSVAQHAAHLRFALDLTAERLRGANPPADWAASFTLTDGSESGWEALKRDLRRAYDAVVSATFRRSRTRPSRSSRASATREKNYTWSTLYSTPRGTNRSRFVAQDSIDPAVVINGSSVAVRQGHCCV